MTGSEGADVTRAHARPHACTRTRAHTPARTPAHATTAKKSLYEYVPFDSRVEEKFAKELDENTEVRYFTKLPRWFEIETPVGRYRPDWAIIKTNGDVVYFVRETKSDTDPRTKRDSERSKFLSGIAHFRAIHVDFDWTNTASGIELSSKP